MELIFTTEKDIKDRILVVSEDYKTIYFKLLKDNNNKLYDNSAVFELESEGVEVSIDVPGIIYLVQDVKFSDIDLLYNYNKKSLKNLANDQDICIIPRGRKFDKSDVELTEKSITDNNFYLKDSLRIQNVCRINGYDLLLSECQYIWSVYSGTMSAGWLGIMDNETDDYLFELIKPILPIESED